MRLYYGTYGHHLSGKLYVYWGDDNYRTGQQVIAPVTNKFSGKTYNTMFTIGKSGAATSKATIKEITRLGEAGINIKTLGSRDLLSLPGGKNFETKKQWKADSERRYRIKHNLPPLTEKPKSTQSRKTRSAKGNKEKQSKLSRLKQISSTGIKDDAVERAKSALRSGKTASDGFKPRERLKRMKQREAFEE